MRNFFLVVTLFVGFHVSAFSTTIKGHVVCKGKGIEGVVVTDGENCVTTDVKGNYMFPVSENSRFVYISTPSGYIPPDSMNIPIFYKRLDLKNTVTYDFELKKNPRNDNIHVLIVNSDPQFFKESNFERYSTVVDDCKKTVEGNKDIDVFGIDCGDLTGEKPSLYPQYIEYLNRTGIPFYRVIGNHDMNYGGRTDETSDKTFTDIFGPTYYSFNRGKVHYVVIDNVFYFGRDYFYMGYINEKIFHWLEQDLSYIQKGSTVFVAMHIPVCLTDKPLCFSYNSDFIGEQTVNASSLFKMLRPYNVHLLTGHSHYNKNVIHYDSIYEHNTAATCGTWWQGDYCLDGTPIGYGVYRCSGSKVSWYFKSAGYPRTYQIRVYPAGSIPELPSHIVANVWNYDRNWTVKWYENGIDRGIMRRFEGIDPEVAKMCADKKKLEFDWICPLPTEHMFCAIPQIKNSRIEIEATDPFGEVFKATLQQ